MPVSRTVQAPDTPNHLRPYTHHGIDLTVRGTHATGDCPFCGRDGKLSVSVSTGLWRCFVCASGTTAGGGNALVFIRLLWERSHAASLPTPFGREAAADRRLADVSTPATWGVCRSLVCGSWLVPGYGTDGKLDQLYRRVYIDGGWRLLPTPGIWPEGRVHALHAANVDPLSPNVYVCEGPWDGMALWEVSRMAPSTLPDACIVAVPGCNVWRDEWSAWCRGRNVTLLYDSDHPRAIGNNVSRAGWDGMRRVASRLQGIAASTRIIHWGPDGYDPERASGWDVRDHIAGHPSGDRVAALRDLVSRIGPVPDEWCVVGSNGVHTGNGRADAVEPLPCDTWAACEAAWCDALEWRGELGDALCTMLAVAASTQQAGDNQLFLQVIGDPGSAKTRMCKGLLVSSRCKPVLHLKSFHSGYKGEDGKDVSFVSRINGLCLVTPEADALSIGMSWEQLNSQMRQIFDGDTGHTYGNSAEDVRYTGLRSPWIQAGTPALMDKDQSRLGDRFLRIRIAEPAQATKRAIMLRSLRNERAAVVETANGSESSIISPKLRRAYALTGGYVDWLRANVEERIALVEMDDAAEERCCDLAELTADMRARPNMDPKKHEVHHTKELGSRLAGQFGRLALCLGVVLNKPSVDADVLRIVRKVALDTSHGHTLNIAQWLCSPNPKVRHRLYQETGGLMQDILVQWSGMNAEKLVNYLSFMRKIGILERRPIKQTHGSWVLTERVYDLYLRVMSSE